MSRKVHCWWVKVVWRRGCSRTECLWNGKNSDSLRWTGNKSQRGHAFHHAHQSGPPPCCPRLSSARMALYRPHLALCVELSVLLHWRMTFQYFNSGKYGALYLRNTNRPPVFPIYKVKESCSPQYILISLSLQFAKVSIIIIYWLDKILPPNRFWVHSTHSIATN